MQAWLAGVPVVGTKVVGIKDTLIDGKTGLLCSVTDPQELANILIDLQKYPEYGKTFAANGAKEVREKYAEAATYEQYARYFLDQSLRPKR